MKRITTKALAARQAANAPRNILCLAIDRLNADFLGAYGNTWIESPAFDALAAESVLFDSYYATSLDLPTLYRAFWRGESPVDVRKDEKAPEAGAPDSLFRALKEQGYRTFVVSDSEEITLHDAVDSDYCDERYYLGAPAAQEPVEQVEETKFFRNFEALARFIAKLEDESELGESAPWFVWAHFSGWNNFWDWSLERRERYREYEEDPEPYAGTTPPYFPDVQKTLGPDVDLEQIELRQSVVEAYAGGISVFDETLEGFARLLDERGVLSKTLFVVTGVRGFGTGAPSALGVAPEGVEPAPFYAEEVRVPLLIRLPDKTGATLRLSGLCEPRDLFETLNSWPTFVQELADPEFWKIERSEISPFAGKWTLDEKPEASEHEDSETTPTEKLSDTPGQNLLSLLVDESGSARDCVRIAAVDADSEERALVVKDWILKKIPNSEDAAQLEHAPKTRKELFVLPDDRYCVNDVANRCLDIIEELEKKLR